MKKYYIGIDLGGTFIKGGVVDNEGNIIAEGKLPTESEFGGDRVATNIATLAQNVLNEAGVDKALVVGVGIGSPGMIDSKKGEVVFSGNLHWEHFPIANKVEARLGLPTKLANDANVAALGETKFGSGKAYENTLLITLGTGVGGGIIIDGKLFEGNRSAGAELGHAVLMAGGEACTCGRKGCFEAYASATALIRDTKRAMEADLSSAMWEIGGLDAVTGKTAFDYCEQDESAKKVVDKYITMLGTGLVNLANEFRPEAIILGGGVCAEGDRLLKPLQKIMDSEIFAGEKGPQVKLLIATLGNRAGLLGAAALWM